MQLVVQSESDFVRRAFSGFACVFLTTFACFRSDIRGKGFDSSLLAKDFNLMQASKRTPPATRGRFTFLVSWLVGKG